ncbi:hypothetical protein ONK20_25740, partial [Salmonella enterica subsp. enterica serovar Montevideo]|nr:hypothetical protein [Salmonella enterica subsp. enterica serovar Montevideo]
RHQQAGLSLVESADKYAELEKEKETLEAEIIRLREVHSQKLRSSAGKSEAKCCHVASSICCLADGRQERQKLAMVATSSAVTP